MPRAVLLGPHDVNVVFLQLVEVGFPAVDAHVTVIRGRGIGCKIVLRTVPNEASVRKYGEAFRAGEVVDHADAIDDSKAGRVLRDLERKTLVAYMAVARALVELGDVQAVFFGIPGPLTADAIKCVQSASFLSVRQGVIPVAYRGETIARIAEMCQQMTRRKATF